MVMMVKSTQTAVPVVPMVFVIVKVLDHKGLVPLTEESIIFPSD